MANTTKSDELLPVPGHISDSTGLFCQREGVMAPGGRCPDGCDHAEHYSNDGHPECEDDPGILKTLLRRKTSGN